MEQERLDAEPASLISNSTWMLAARMYGLLVGGVLSIVAARTFSLESFGYYAIALSLVAIFGMLSEAGLGFLAMRRYGEDRRSEAAVLGIALSAEVLTSLAAIALMVPLALLLGYPSAVVVPVAVGGLIVLAQGFISPIDALFHSRRRLFYAAVAVAVGWTVTAAIGLVALALGGGPASLVAAMAAGYCASAFTGAALLPAKTKVRVSLERNPRPVLRFVRASLPIAAAAAVAVVYQRIDTLIVSKLVSASGAALYSVAFTIVQFFLVIPSIVGGAYFPVLSSELERDPENARRSLVLLNKVFLLASVAVAMVLTFAADEVLRALFGARYEDSATALAILAWTIPCLFLQQLYWYALLARYRERTALVIALTFLLINVALNLALVAAYEVDGAAVALLITDLGITLAQATVLHRRDLKLPVGVLLARPVIAAVPAVVVGVLVNSTSGILAGIAAGALFAALLVALGYLPRAEWEPLMGPIRRLRIPLTPSR